MKEYIVTDYRSLCAALDDCRTHTEQAALSFSAGSMEIPETVVLPRGDLHLRGNGAVLSGSRRLNFSDCVKEGNTVVADLRALGIPMGTIGEGPFEEFWQVYDIPKPHMYEEGPGLEVFYDGKPLRPARYPKEGLISISKIYGTTPSTDAWLSSANTRMEGIFSCEDDFVRHIAQPEDIWLFGYWAFDWATQRNRVESIDPESGIITLCRPWHTFGYRPDTDGKGGRFCIYNAREALTEPGEWYLDRKAEKLYLIPLPGQTYLDISMAGDLFAATGVHNLSFEGFSLKQCRGCGIRLTHVDRAQISDCHVENTGAWGIVGDDCRNSVVRDCTVTGTAGGGISLSGGDRATLISGGNRILHNTVREIARFHRTYMAAIEIGGVGGVVAENTVRDVPHFGIVYSGNNHVIERNEIENACYESHDAGAIYSGRNYTYQGIVIRYNYLHRLHGLGGMGCRGIYFDDCVSSAEVYGNIFTDMAYAAIQLGGGRGFSIHHNVFHRCRAACTYDNRGMTWNYNPRLLERLAEVDWQGEIWAAAYPKLAAAPFPDSSAFAPADNHFTDNLIVGGAGFCVSSQTVADMTEFARNTFIPDETPTKPLPGYISVINNA